MERCSASLALKNTQIKTMMRYDYIHLRPCKFWKMTIVNAGDDAEKLDQSYTLAGRTANDLSNLEKDLPVS